jgi:uncharacterized membrane protein
MHGLEALVVLVALALLVAPFVGITVALRARRSLRELEARVLDLERGPLHLRAPAVPTPAARPRGIPVPAPGLPPVTTPPMPAEAQARARPAMDWRQWERWLGGTWLNRVGALVLVLGIGFFLKYAFDHRWIQPAGRVALGLVAGVTLLLVGERLQRAAYRAPAQGVVAAGIATLYLSVYAAYGFYQLIAQATAFAVMVLVTATSLALALHHDARAVAILANLGGFLTPILLGADRDAAVAVFTYLAVLDAGLLASAYWRRWPELQALSFVFTQFLYWGWFDRWYHPVDAAPQRAVALIAASAFFVLFALATPVEAAGRRFALRLDRWWHPSTLLILAAPVAYFVAARAILYPELKTWLALLCLGVAAVSTALGRWAIGAPAGASLALLQWAVGLAFLTLAFPIQFTEHGTTIAWSVEGAAIVWGGFRLDARRLRLGGLAVLTLAALRWLVLVLEPVPHSGAFVLDHPVLIPTAFLALGATVTAVIYRWHQLAGVALAEERFAWPILALVAVLSGALFLTLELQGHRALGLTAGVASVVTTLIWLAAAGIVTALAPSDATRTLLAAGVLLLGLVGLRAAVLDTGHWQGMAGGLAGLNLRFASGLLITAVYAVFSWMIPALPIPDERRAAARAAVVASAALFLLWHLSAEVVLMPLEGVPAGELTMARHMGLSLLWTCYAFAAMGVGIQRGQPALRLGAIGLFGLTVAKVFLVDLSRLDAGYRILSFIVLGGLLLLASFLYTRYRKRILGEAP